MSVSTFSFLVVRFPKPSLSPPFNSSLVETQLKRHVVDASSRWSFDFSTDQPIRSPDSKYVWERIPQLDDRLAMSPTPDNGPGPVMTLSSAAHMRTIQVVAGASSPSSRSASSSANSSLVSSPSTSMCHSDLETDMEVSGRVSGISTGDLNAAGSSNDGAATKRMVQKKMTGEFLLQLSSVASFPEESRVPSGRFSVGAECRECSAVRGG